MAASSNTRSGGNEKIIQKAKNKAEIKRIINPNTTKNDIHNMIQGAILFNGLAGMASKGNAARAGAKAQTEALAKSVPKTSKTMNVPKGSKVITSGKSGSANATSNVKKVTIQKSPVRVQAGIKANATVKGRAASASSSAIDYAQARGAVNLATIYAGVKNPVKKKK